MCTGIDLYYILPRIPLPIYLTMFLLLRVINLTQNLNLLLLVILRIVVFRHHHRLFHCGGIIHGPGTRPPLEQHVTDVVARRDREARKNGKEGKEGKERKMEGGGGRGNEMRDTGSA
jgi:hypothetical protein